MLGQLLLESLARHGEAVALIDGDRRLSHREVAEGALRWARLLEARIAKGSNAPLALQLPNSADYAVIVTALLLLGVPVLPVNPQWSPAEVARSLGGQRLAGVLASRPSLANWQACPAFASTPLLPLEELLEQVGQIEPLPPPVMDPALLENRPALCLMTSGTTGEPKVVVRTHGNLLANARQVGSALDWQAGWRVLPVTPFHHANGFSNGMLLPLLRGCCVIVLRQFFPATVTRLMRDPGVDVLVASPVVYQSLLASPDDALALGTLRQALSSGAPLPADVCERAAAMGVGPIRELYGSSETGTISIEPARRTGAVRSAGIPVPGVEVAILSDQGAVLPVGAVGLVGIRSPAVMQGYWTPGGLDPARSPQGWYLTGDRGFLDPSGELHLQGRVRAFINVGGNKVDPGEIETLLQQIPGVVRGRVSGRPRSTGGEMISARVTVRPGCGLDQAALLAALRPQLAEYKLPRHFELQEDDSPALPDKHTSFQPGKN